LDLNLPKISGHDVLKALKAAAFQAGGTAYVLKRDASSSLVEALNSALARIRYTSPSVQPVENHPRRTSTLGI
jgi:DNA-binding NarL/FixJ family response regulator